MIKGLEKTINDTVKEYFGNKLGNRRFAFKDTLVRRVEELLTEENSEESHLDKQGMVNFLENTINNPRVQNADKLKALNKLAELKNIGSEDREINVEIINFSDLMEQDEELSKLKDKMEENKGIYLYGAKDQGQLPSSG